MKTIMCLVTGVAFFVLSCSHSSVGLQQSQGLNVDLVKGNYKIVKSGVEGKSHGFWLIGILPVLPLWWPSKNGAIQDMRKNAAMETGRAQALVNIVQEWHYGNFIIFGIPSWTISCDVVEFDRTADLDESSNTRLSVEP